ncbi:MAG TPA: class I SAM-dependent methyltransferase [Nitrososphaera sp.]|nr:class I SAM-dependent methyltransferase [Nitrososphaera sp.]
MKKIRDDLRKFFNVHSDRMRRLISGRPDLLWYPVRARLMGFDFNPVMLEELGLSSQRSTPYGNSGGPDLNRVLKAIDIPVGSKVLDLGSGKGGAIITLSEFPFKEIVGVELSAGLIQIAEANTLLAGLRHVRFVNADAATFTDLDNFTHIYMYHPFPCGVMGAVMVNLASSLARAERNLTLIYTNPVCHEAIMASGLFEVDREFNFDENLYQGHKYCVYVHRSGNVSRALPRG